MNSILALFFFWHIANSGTVDNVQMVQRVLEVSQKPASGFLVMPLQSEKLSRSDASVEIGQALEMVVNSGKFNIIEIQTNYENGTLRFANVFYTLEHGAGNDLRLMILASERFDLLSRSEEVRRSIEMIVNSGKWNIVKVQTIYYQSYLLAAEVYYREKK